MNLYLILQPRQRYLFISLLSYNKCAISRPHHFIVLWIVIARAASCIHLIYFTERE